MKKIYSFALSYNIVNKASQLVLNVFILFYFYELQTDQELVGIGKLIIRNNLNEQLAYKIQYLKIN